MTLSFQTQWLLTSCWSTILLNFCRTILLLSNLCKVWTSSFQKVQGLKVSLMQMILIPILQDGISLTWHMFIKSYVSNDLSSLLPLAWLKSEIILSTFVLVWIANSLSFFGLWIISRLTGWTILSIWFEGLFEQERLIAWNCV